jgi:UDP-glucuronate decarboxylase
MTTEGLAGEVLNLATDDERTILELAETLLEVVDTDVEIRYEPRPEDDPERRKPDLSRVRDRLDWEPDVSLREGLKRTVEHFETHE